MKPRILLLCVASALLGAVLTALYHDPLPLATPSQAQTTFANRTTPAPPVALPDPTVSTSISLTPEELANIRVYEVANHSVVNITTSTVQYDRFRFLPIPGEGSGSGSIIDKQGHILTNSHVVEGARKIEVTLANGNVYPAELIGADAEFDLAVIKIEAPSEELFPIRLGRSDTLKVGQRAYVLGNPFGLAGSLTTGIISSLDRSLPSRVTDREMTSIIQTDAAMNPGNSGGPMLDSSGQMIGMNVAIATKTGQSAGVGFVIPVDRIRRFLPDLIKHGKVIRAHHGIVSVMESKQGLRIVKLSENGPAERAGLRGVRLMKRQVRQGPLVYSEPVVDRESADVIVTIDGRPLEDHMDFLEIMDSHKPGDTINLTILREGRTQHVQMTLDAA